VDLIERHMFRHITPDRGGKPLASREVIVNLVTATTNAGLSVRSGVDDNRHATGIKVSDDRMETLPIRRTGFHVEWKRSPHTNGQFIPARLLRGLRAGQSVQPARFYPIRLEIRYGNGE